MRMVINVLCNDLKMVSLSIINRVKMGFATCVYSLHWKSVDRLIKSVQRLLTQLLGVSLWPLPDYEKLPDKAQMQIGK